MRTADCTGRWRLEHRSMTWVALALLMPLAAVSKTYETRADALARVFGSEARIERRSVFLTEAQIDAAQAMARTRIELARVTFHEAFRDDVLLGRAYLDTHQVRSQHATLLVVIGPNGQTRNVDVLAFHEPEDYRPPSRWYRRLEGRDLSQRLHPGDDVDAISGATLSVRTSTAAVRRILAIDRVLHGERP